VAGYIEHDNDPSGAIKGEDLGCLSCSRWTLLHGVSLSRVSINKRKFISFQQSDYYLK
jgi:hypothetical protein